MPDPTHTPHPTSTALHRLARGLQRGLPPGWNVDLAPHTARNDGHPTLLRVHFAH